MKLSLITTFMILLFTMSANTVDIHASEIEKGITEPKILAVTMHADWCGKCKTMDPKLSSIKKEFKDTGILFTILDMTDEFTKSQAQMQATLMGIQDLFQQHEGKTGYTVIIDAETGKELDRITHDLSEEEMRNKLNASI